jgi:ubiquinone/menaquinone biosynthesis C-methylase UbiE
MQQPPQTGHPEPALYESISEIIRRHSSNRVDIRRAALEGLDLMRAHHLLDLGCGFGFMARGMARRVAKEATIICIDCDPANRPAFLASAASAGCRGSFLCRTLGAKLEFPSRAFDLVTASYSLYFFPGITPEVARVLQPGGTFLAVTHSERDSSSLLAALGVPPQRSALHALIKGFSAENGASLLRPHFAHVERRSYLNTLTFRAADLNEFLTLMRFRAHRLTPAGVAVTPAEVAERAADLLRYTGSLTIEKDDAIFLCTGPRP